MQGEKVALRKEFIEWHKRHAAARIEDDTETHRHAIVAEMRDVLQLAVFVDGEVLAAEPGHETSVLVSDRCGHVDEIDTALKPEALLRLGGGHRRRSDHGREDESMPLRSTRNTICLFS